MDVIQCEDLSEYLIWKWRPNKDAEVGQSRKENTIRNGSPLIVKDGQAAVFQYPQGGYDIFIDQHTTKLSTDNMPVLAGLVGTLFAGGSPCPAQIYFVNLQTSVKVPFYVPDIRLTPPSQQTYGDMNLEFSDLRVSVKGVVTMAVPRDAESIRVLLRSFGGNDTKFYVWEERVQQSIPAAVREISASSTADRPTRRYRPVRRCRPVPRSLPALLSRQRCRPVRLSRSRLWRRSAAITVCRLRLMSSSFRTAASGI